MKITHGLVNAAIGLLAVLILIGAPGAHAGVVTDANTRAADVVSRVPSTPIAVRMMAIVQVSVFEAVNAVTGRYPPQRAKLTPAPGASVEAAVAAATRTALSKLVPAQQAAIDADYQALLGSVPDGPAKTAGIARRAGRDRDRRALRRRRRGRPRRLSPARGGGRLRAHGGAGGAPLGPAPSLGDAPRRSLPPGPPARAHQ